MTTRREQVLSALHGLIKGAFEGAATVTRMADLPEEVPDGGLINLVDDAGGERAEPEVILSPLTFVHTHLAELEVVVPGDDSDTRHAALDDMLAKIDAAIAADRTLGGLADYAQLLTPDTSNVTFEAADTNKAASVLVEITYSSNSRLG